MTTRREFLKVLGTSTSAVALSCPFAACGTDERDVDAGNIDDYDDGLTAVENEGVIIGKDGDGFYAMTAICTHLQCDMSDAATNSEVDGDTMACGCHGSTYDVDGGNTGGPATKPLEHFEMVIADDGAITVKVGTVVDDKERYKAP